MIHSNDLHYVEFDLILKSFRKFKIHAIRPIAFINFHPMSKEYIEKNMWKENHRQVLINGCFGLQWINVLTHDIITIKRRLDNEHDSKC